MADLLLELFSEEIPARMQAEALQHLQTSLLAGLHNAGFASNLSIRGYVTPRRLAVIIEGLPEIQAASETELKGPKIGAPEAAVQGFLKKNQLTLSDLIERDGIYFAIVKKEGRPTAEIVKSLIESLLSSFPWPKSMRWGSNDASWVRPLHSIVCLFAGQVVPVGFAGVTAGNSTYGHRFLSRGAIAITDAADYEAALEKSFVIADRGKRKTSVLAQAETLAAKHGLGLKKDEGLLEEVTGLVEWPVVLAGKIDDEFMDLPKEVLVSEMRAHQKYFALETADDSLSDRFLITANITAKDDGNAIIAGNERVLRARLADGRFFWDQDRKKTLEQWAEGLRSVTYHAKLGTIADKVERITMLALQLAPRISPSLPLPRDTVSRAAALCKADLVTGMVGEFPELQGVMGRYYAQGQNEADAVSDAIRDHYKPQGPNDAVPTQPLSICIALADKFDTLISLFAIGEKPTGSKDPFALRRAALGIIRIILENNIRLSLLSVIPAQAPQQVRGDIVSFLIDRLKVQLKDSGIRHDVINAVVAGGDDDLVRIVSRVKALQDFLNSEDGVNLLASYKRAGNILSIESKKDNIVYYAGIAFEALKLPEEQELKKAMAHTVENVAPLLASENFTSAMRAFSALRIPLDNFFDKVLVNDADPALRKQRLCLLAEIKQAFDQIAHFALIEG